MYDSRVSSPVAAAPALAPPRHPGAFWPAVFLVALTLLAYLPVTKAGYVWDDDALLTGNPNMLDAQGLWRTWTDPEANLDYYPLTFTSWWLEWRLWGDKPLGYHANNVLMHACVALVLWRVLRRLGFSPSAAWITAALFALHPVQVESVAWVAERKNTLSGLFYMLAAYAFVRFIELDDAEPRRGARWRWYALSLLLYVCAMLSKPLVMTLAAALPLAAWARRGRITRRDIGLAIPYLTLAVPMAGLTMWVQHHNVGARGEEFSHTMLDRVLIAGRAWWFYLSKLAAPVNLTFAYERWDIRATQWWQWFYPLAALVAAGVAWARRRTLGVGVFIAIAFFTVTLSPALGFIPVYWHRYYFVADHMQYVACIGPLAVAAQLIASALARPPSRRIAIAGAGVVLAVLGVQTFTHCFAYRDAMTLWQDTIRKNPDSWMAIGNRGVQYEIRGDLARARADYERAIELNPRHYESLTNLAAMLAREQSFSRAETLARRAIEANPRYGPAYHALATPMIEAGRPEVAVAVYREAVAARPRDLEMRYRLAVVLARTGAIAECHTRFAEALKRGEDDAMTLRAMGRFLELQSRRGDAIAFYRKALAKEANDIESMQRLAWLLATVSDDALRDGAEAVRLGERGAELTRGQAPEMLDALAAAYAEAGRFDEAASLASRVAASADAMARSLPPPASDRARQLAQAASRHAAAYTQKRPWREPAK